MNGNGGALVMMDELDLNAVEAALAMLDGDLSSALTRRASCSEPSAAPGTAVVDSFSSLERAQFDCQFAAGNEGATTATHASSKPKRKRTRDPAVDVRRRARRREERQELQRQAERYEQQLKTLAVRAAAKETREAIDELDAADEDELKVWEDVAREQSRHRAASEELNRQLKSKLAAHYDLSKRVGQMLFELASLHEKVGATKQGGSVACSSWAVLTRYVVATRVTGQDAERCERISLAALQLLLPLRHD